MSEIQHAESKKVASCSFCGVQKSPETPLIAGNEGMICEACVQLAHQVVSNWGRKEKSLSMIKKLCTPKEIMEHLNHYVIGQEEAKETLSVAIYNHYLRLLNQGDCEDSLQTDATTELEKSNVLMAGPSGTGKTLLIKSLAKVIGVPIVIADATTLTQAGYVGDDVDSVLQRLLEAADGDVTAAEWGIVYIDEIDKLAGTGGGSPSVRDVSGEGVQQALLKMVEGAQVKLTKGDKRRSGGEEVMIDTTNVLFVVGGAFPGLERIIKERVQPKQAVGIGFHVSDIHPEPSKAINELMPALQPEDFQQFGIIPEFIGRFPIITFLEELDIDSLLRILQEPNNALVKQYAKLFKYQGVELEFTEPALRLIAQRALDRGTGARGLRSIMESVLRKTMFEMPSRKDVNRCIVDEKTVNEASEIVVSEILAQGWDAHESSAVDIDSELEQSPKKLLHDGLQ